MVLRWVPSVYGYHQVDALSRYCADSPILCVGSSNRGKDKSPSREKKLPSNTPLDEPRKLFGFVGLSSIFSRFFMENGDSFAGWRVSCASESAITVHCPMWITIKTYREKGKKKTPGEKKDRLVVSWRQAKERGKERMKGRKLSDAAPGGWSERERKGSLRQTCAGL